MTESIEDAQFPAGTPVCVKQRIERRGESYEIEVIGVVQSWEELPTGSWFAHAEGDRLHLKRLRLRKADGEESLLVIDDSTEITKLEPAG